MYGSQIWWPLLIKDMKPIESLQRQATKYIEFNMYQALSLVFCQAATIPSSPSASTTVKQ